MMAIQEALQSASRKRWRLTDQPLAVQFLTAGGIVAFFSIVSLFLLLSQVSSQTQASRFLSETHLTVERLNSLGHDLSRQETAVLEYLRTRDTRYLISVHDGRQLWSEGIKVIDQLVSNDASEFEILKQIRQSYQSWLKVSDELINGVNVPLHTRELGAPEPQPDSILLRKESDLFKQDFLLIERLIEVENQQLAIREESEKNATQATFIAIAAINVALLIIFGIALVELYFSIARPIADLSSTMGRYQEGDFKARVLVSNRSQIGFLQSSFNSMAEKTESMVLDLRNLDQMKSEFISTVSHELRTPLTSIGGYAKLLASGDAGDVTETQKEFLYIIDTNVVRLTHLINDILDVEKMEVGKVQLVREPQDVVSVLKECRDTFGILASQKGLELRYDVPELMPPVLGDRGRLVQIFMNLLSNAIKYTESGFVELQAEASELAVSIRVRDSGIGLTEEEKEKLFQKFYRTRSGLSSAEGGTGLGLAIVRGLVEAHNGTVTVDSVSGKGTTFTVTLPVTTPIVDVEELVQIDSGDMHETSVLAWQRPIWIIDPEESAVNQMSRMIDQAGPLFKGYRLSVRNFASINEVPESVPGTEAPFIVILDPKSENDPHKAISELRRRLHRTVPILIVSDSVDTAEVFAEGASALLTKPIGEREFLIAVKDLISAKGWRILLADRNTDLRLLLKRSLEQRGFTVDDVDRGAQVMSRLEQEDYDLVLIDMNFTDVPAIELLKVIRRAHDFTSLPVFVMMNEDRNLPSKEQLISWGANAYVGKFKGIGGIVDSVCQFLEDRKIIEQHN